MTSQNESVKDAQARYLAAVHAMQSGIAVKLGYDPTDVMPKHLRVGVNSAMVQHAALAKLLMDKGVITEEEYFTAQADAMEKEKALYEEEIGAHFGKPINLS